MRRVLFCCAVLVLAILMVPGCSWFGTREQKPGTVPTQSTPTEKLPPEAEVKSEPAPAPPAAAPPAVTPAPVAEPAEAGHPASPAEQTKETLGPKPAQTAALAPPRSTTAPATPEESAQTAPEPESATARPEAEPTKAASPEKPAAKAEKAAPATEPASAPTKASPEKTPAAKDSSSVAVVGDSLAVGIGMTMEQRLKQEGMGCFPLGKVSTGLISKRFFDWEKRLTELVAKEKLSAVVVMMGGNDANNPIAGKAAGTPEWGAAYREKAENFLRIAANAGVKVLWVGLPAMREPAYASRVKAVNMAAREACTTVSGCSYMEASDIFVDASGKYVQAKDIGGKKVSLRAKDGVHMTMNGYDLLCRQVIDRLGKAGELPPKAQ